MMAESSMTSGEDPILGKAQSEGAIASMQKTLKARANAKRGFAARRADQMTAGFGSMPFLAVNCAWSAVWIVVNLGFVPAARALDPFPFGLLTMIVSLEAIILAIVVLISQNRAPRIADLREEVALQVEEVGERETTKLLLLVVRLLEEQDVDLSHSGRR